MNSDIAWEMAVRAGISCFGCQRSLKPEEVYFITDITATGREDLDSPDTAAYFCRNCLEHPVVCAAQEDFVRDIQRAVRSGRPAEAVVSLAKWYPTWNIARIADYLGIDEALARRQLVSEIADESDGWTPGHRMAAYHAGAKFARPRDIGTTDFDQPPYDSVLRSQNSNKPNPIATQRPASATDESPAPYWQDAFATQPLFAAWVKRPFAKPVFVLVKDGHGHNHRPTPDKPNTLLPQAAAQTLAADTAMTMIRNMALRTIPARYHHDRLPLEQRDAFCRSHVSPFKQPSCGTALALGAPLADATLIGAVLFLHPYLPVERADDGTATLLTLRDDVLKTLHRLGSVVEKVRFYRVAAVFRYEGLEALALHALTSPPGIQLVLNDFFYRDADLLMPDEFCELKVLAAADIATAIGAELPATNPFGFPVNAMTPRPTGELRQLTAYGPARIASAAPARRQPVRRPRG